MRWLVLLFFPVLAWSHPVIYQDGWVISSMSMSDMTDAGVSYSFSPKWSAGANYWRLQDKQGDEQEYQLAKLNHLLWRHNGDDSQANIYLHSGVGRSEWREIKDRLAVLGGVEADWETRRHFISGKYLHLRTSDYDTGIWVGRVGLSPILADFQDLQTWAMVQVWYDPITAREAKITPLLRFFYHNVLWEMGSSLKGDMMLNLMVHL